MTHEPAQLENWETKQRCVCGAGDFATKRELDKHIRAVMTQPGVDAVAEVIRRHKQTTRRIPSKRSRFLQNVTACKGCDWVATDIDYAAHETHVATAAVEALQLTEEHGSALRSRLVGPWVREEQP